MIPLSVCLEPPGPSWVRALPHTVVDPQKSSGALEAEQAAEGYYNAHPDVAVLAHNAGVPVRVFRLRMNAHGRRVQRLALFAPRWVSAVMGQTMYGFPLSRMGEVLRKLHADEDLVMELTTMTALLRGQNDEHGRDVVTQWMLERFV